MDNPRFRFETFIVSTMSRRALSAAISAAENPGCVHNPLVLYGPVGSGKTHLLHAITQLMRSRRPDSLILRLSTEEFVDRLIAAIRCNAVIQFRQFLFAAHTVLLDDIDVLVDKPRTLEEVLHTVAELVDRRIQVVITTRQRSKRLRLTNSELRTWFPFALTARVDYPDRNARVEILRSACESAGVFAAEDLLQALAGRSTGSPRELMSLVARMTVDSITSSTASGSPHLGDVRSTPDRL